MRAEMRGRVMPPSFQTRRAVSHPYPARGRVRTVTLGPNRSAAGASPDGVRAFWFDGVVIPAYTSPTSGPREQRTDASSRFSGIVVHGLGH
ncbi:hypothetical protein Mame01_21820 [Microbispora amethystogenes]|nr:hypothetical protein Mame01_21820 [Microbispora amethystogenes]